MEFLKLKNGVLISALALALSACGSSSSDAPAVTPTAGLSGKVVDGYVSGATVTMDLNDDRICSSTEPTVTTNGLGGYTFTAAANTNNGQHMICSSGGVDISSGAAFVGELKAPPGSSVLSPLTSLVQAAVDSTLPAPVVGTPSAPTAAAITTAVTNTATNLNLTGVNLITADPVTHSNTSLIQTTAAVQTILSATTKHVASATGLQNSGSTVNNAVFQNAVQAVLASLTATPVTSTATLSNLSTSVVTGTVTRMQTNPVVSALGNVSTASPTSIAAVASNAVSKATQDIVSVPVSQLISSNGGAAAAVASITQTQNSVANTINTIKDMLSTSFASGVGATDPIFSNLSTAILAAAPQSGVSAASAVASVATLNQQIQSAVTAAAASGVAVSAPTVAISTLLLSNPTVNGNPVNIASGVAVAGAPTSAGMTVTVNGKPTLPSTVSAGISIKQTTGTRELNLLIDEVNLSCVNGSDVAEACTSTSTVKVSVPTTAKLYVYGVTAAGATASATLSNTTAASMISSQGNAVNINWTPALTALVAKGGAFTNLLNVKGTFDVKVGFSGDISMTKTVGETADVITSTVPDSAAFPNGGVFAGQGTAVTVTVN
ncbi:MAG: hypothetical protein WC742_04535 [Gallionellaceae bacterium]|jgi:hypothetical protein